MKVKEIIQRVQGLYSKGVQSNSSRLSSRHIFNKALSVRTLLFSQKIKKKQDISSWSYQTLTCVELIRIPRQECSCVPSTDCEVLRSKYQIPNIIMGFTENLIKSVSAVDRSIKIDVMSINAINSKKGNKYTASRAAAFLENGYLFITTPSTIENVSLMALFENPLDIFSFKSCDSEENICIDYMDQDFKIDADLVDGLVSLVAQELVATFMQGIEDMENNSIDDVTIHPKQ